MNKYAEYKEAYKAMIKEALFNDDKMSPEGLAATINAVIMGGGGALQGAGMANMMGGNKKNMLLSALLAGTLSGGIGAGLGALGAKAGKNIDNPVGAYLASGLLGGWGGMAGTARARD